MESFYDESSETLSKEREYNDSDDFVLTFSSEVKRNKEGELKKNEREWQH